VEIEDCELGIKIQPFKMKQIQIEIIWLFKF